MKNKFSTIISAVQALAALCVIGAIKLWAPVCGKMLLLENGNETHMKCFYSGQAGIALAVVLLAAAVVGFLAKNDHKKVQLISIVGAILLFMTFTSLIGICANAEMACHGTAAWVKGAAAVTVVAGLASFFSGKEGQIPD